MDGGSSGAIFELLGQHVDLVGRAVITALDRLGLVEVWAGLLAFIQLMWVTHPPHSAIHSRTKFLLAFHNLALEGYCHDNYKHQMTLLMARQNTNQGLLSGAFKFSTPGLSECALRCRFPATMATVHCLSLWSSYQVFATPRLSNGTNHIRTCPPYLGLEMEIWNPRFFLPQRARNV